MSTAKLVISIGGLVILGLLINRMPAGADEDVWEQPALITSAGQSAEVQLASVLAKRAEIDFVLKKAAGPEDLAGMKTLVLSLGASLKGLGAAGLDVAQEKDRVGRLMEAARSRNIPVLCLHLGGEARRGQLSDEFVTAFLPGTSLALVVESGNQDGLFTKLCAEHDIPLIEVDRAVNALAPLKKLFE
jgi:hypothetical protein